MNDNFCLTKKNLNDFIEYSYGNKIFNTELERIIKQAENWEVNIICLNYFLSQILEAKQKTHLNSVEIIDKLYEINNLIYSDMEEFSASTIDKILNCDVKNHDLSLEENLIQIIERIYNYEY